MAELWSDERFCSAAWNTAVSLASGSARAKVWPELGNKKDKQFPWGFDSFSFTTSTVVSISTRSES